MKDITTPKGSKTSKVVYYPNENADKDGPQVESPRLQSLSKKMECAREYAARLALLLHARSCSEPSSCKVKNCHTAQSVLNHCMECSRVKCHVSCRQAKVLLRHHRMCKSTNIKKPCLVCTIMKRDFARHLLSDAKQRKLQLSSPALPHQRISSPHVAQLYQQVSVKSEA